MTKTDPGAVPTFTPPAWSDDDHKAGTARFRIYKFSRADIERHIRFMSTLDEKFDYLVHLLRYYQEKYGEPFEP